MFRKTILSRFIFLAIISSLSFCDERFSLESFDQEINDNFSLEKQTLEDNRKTNQLNTLQNTYENYLWLDDDYTLTNQALELIDVLEDSYFHGLNPQNYNLSKIASLVELLSDEPSKITDKEIQKLENLLSNGYLQIASDLYYGAVDWEKFIRIKEKKRNSTIESNPAKLEKEFIEWERDKKAKINFNDLLKSALTTNTIKQSIKNLLPKTKEYEGLVNAMHYYDRLSKNSEWLKIPQGNTIKIGDSDPRIPLIKQRLFVTDALEMIDNLDNIVYNENYLIDAIKNFQEKNGLKADGIIGNNTLKAFNFTPKEAFTKIGINLERLRWQNHTIYNNQKYIAINIPSFKMQFIENGDEVLGMKVIVGSQKRHTPIFQSKMVYAVLNPTWTAPKTIVHEDILQSEDLGEYLESHDMSVYFHTGNSKELIDYNDINWSNYQVGEQLPFSFTAKPGKSNPLGEMKFIFPNKFSVFMHDTNQRDLFKYDKRAFSSGCIRLHEPKKLLDYLASTNEIKLPQMQKMNLQDEEEKEIFVNLKTKIPVILQYLTVRLDPNDNRVQFFDDIYGYDKKQQKAFIMR